MGSFILVPIVEELFYRGYVQSRLEEDFDAPSAILITAVFFTFSHSQYYLAFSAWNVGMLLTLLISSLAWGYIFHRTRSLVPPMIAQALINLPIRGLADFVLPILMVVLIVIYRSEIIEHIKSFFDMFKVGIRSKRALVASALFMTLFPVTVAVAQDLALLFGLLFLVVALVLEALEKRKTRKVIFSATD